MYLLSNGSTFLVQQAMAVVPGTSVFNGTEYGRASLAVPGGAANQSLWFRAKRYGASANSIMVALVNPGGTLATTTATLTGTLVEVRLRTTAGVVQATAAEVAAAVNAVALYGFPVVADYDRSTLGNGVVSAAAGVLLTGGVNPRVEGQQSQFKWDLPLNQNGGLFYFEQEVPIVIRQMGADFPTIAGPTPFKIWIVNMTPGLGFYTAEKVPLFERVLDAGGLGDIGFSDGRSPLLPNQALRVECALPGIVTFHLRMDSGFSSWRLP